MSAGEAVTPFGFWNAVLLGEGTTGWWGISASSKCDAMQRPPTLDFVGGGAGETHK